MRNSTRSVAVVIIVLLALVVIAHVGCAGSPFVNGYQQGKFDQIRAKNREGLVRLEVGMPKASVLAIMGTKNIRVFNGLNSPPRRIKLPVVR